MTQTELRRQIRQAFLAVFLLYAIAGAAMVGQVGCTHAPPTLSPAAQGDFNRTRVVKAIDIIRDAAVDAESAHVLSTDDTRQIVIWHKSAVNVIQASSTGWKAALTTTLDEALKNRPNLQTKLAPYVALFKALLQEV
jgi:hypothetical protein